MFHLKHASWSAQQKTEFLLLYKTVKTKPKENIKTAIAILEQEHYPIRINNPIIVAESYCTIRRDFLSLSSSLQIGCDQLSLCHVFAPVQIPLATCQGQLYIKFYILNLRYFKYPIVLNNYQTTTVQLIQALDTDIIRCRSVDRPEITLMLSCNVSEKSSHLVFLHLRKLRDDL